MNDKLDTLDKKNWMFLKRKGFPCFLHHAYQAYHSYHASVALVEEPGPKRFLEFFFV